MENVIVENVIHFSDVMKKIEQYCISIYDSQIYAQRVLMVSGVNNKKKIQFLHYFCYVQYFILRYINKWEQNVSMIKFYWNTKHFFQEIV